MFKRVLFALFVVLYMPLNELYRLMPEMDIEPYGSSAAFFFWLFKSLALFLVAVGFVVAFFDRPSQFYKAGSVLFLFYTITQLYLTLPLSENLFFGATATSLFTAIGLAVFVYVFAKYESTTESRIKKDLAIERKKNYSLEWHLDEAARNIKSSNQSIVSVKVLSYNIFKKINNLGHTSNSEELAAIAAQSTELMKEIKKAQKTLENGTFHKK